MKWINRLLLLLLLRCFQICILLNPKWIILLFRCWTWWSDAFVIYDWIFFVMKFNLMCKQCPRNINTHTLREKFFVEKWSCTYVCLTHCLVHNRLNMISCHSVPLLMKLLLSYKIHLFNISSFVQIPQPFFQSIIHSGTNKCIPYYYFWNDSIMALKWLHWVLLLKISYDNLTYIFLCVQYLFSDNIFFVVCVCAVDELHLAVVCSTSSFFSFDYPIWMLLQMNTVDAFLHLPLPSLSVFLVVLRSLPMKNFITNLYCLLTCWR